MALPENISNNSTFSIDLRKFDENIKTPSTDVIKDVIFKYEERYMKNRLMKEDIEERRYSEKANSIINYLRNIQHDEESKLDFSKIELLESLEKLISINMLEKIDIVMDLDYKEIRDEINKFEGLIKKTVKNLTLLEKPFVKINSGNFYRVFDPLFSGKFDLGSQFSDLIKSGMSVSYTLNLLNEYLENQFANSKIYSFKDLYEINLSLIPLKFTNVLEVFQHVNIVTYESINQIDLNDNLLNVENLKKNLIKKFSNLKHHVKKEDIKHSEIKQDSSKSKFDMNKLYKSKSPSVTNEIPISSTEDGKPKFDLNKLYKIKPTVKESNQSSQSSQSSQSTIQNKTKAKDIDQTKSNQETPFKFSLIKDYSSPEVQIDNKDTNLTEVLEVKLNKNKKNTPKVIKDGKDNKNPNNIVGNSNKKFSNKYVVREEIEDSANKGKPKLNFAKMLKSAEEIDSSLYNTDTQIKITNNKSNINANSDNFGRLNKMFKKDSKTQPETSKSLDSSKLKTEPNKKPVLGLFNVKILRSESVQNSSFTTTNLIKSDENKSVEQDEQEPESDSMDYNNENIEDFLAQSNYYFKSKHPTKVEFKEPLEIMYEINIKKAVTKYNLDFWQNNIKTIDENAIKVVVERIFKEEQTKDKENIKELCYSLISGHFPELKELITDPDKVLFRIFMNPESENKNINSYTLEDRTESTIFETLNDEVVSQFNMFKTSLGFYGYSSLLNTLSNKKSKKGMKKILSHMKNNKMFLNDELLHSITEICKKFQYPRLLSNLFREYFHENKINVTNNSLKEYGNTLDLYKRLCDKTKNLLLEFNYLYKVNVTYDLFEVSMMRLIFKDEYTNAQILFKQIRASIQKNDSSIRIKDEQVFEAIVKFCYSQLVIPKTINKDRKIYITTLIEESKKLLGLKALTNKFFLLDVMLLSDLLQNEKSIKESLDNLILKNYIDDIVIEHILELKTVKLDQKAKWLKKLIAIHQVEDKKILDDCFMIINIFDKKEHQKQRKNQENDFKKSHEEKMKILKGQDEKKKDDGIKFRQLSSNKNNNRAENEEKIIEVKKEIKFEKPRVIKKTTKDIEKEEFAKQFGEEALKIFY